MNAMEWISSEPMFQMWPNLFIFDRDCNKWERSSSTIHLQSAITPDNRFCRGTDYMNLDGWAKKICARNIRSSNGLMIVGLAVRTHTCMHLRFFWFKATLNWTCYEYVFYYLCQLYMWAFANQQRCGWDTRSKTSTTTSTLQNCAASISYVASNK